MAYSPSDFGLEKSGPQFKWLDERLILHGFPSLRLMDTQRLRVQRFQLHQGWRGTGADGLIGPLTLQYLTADPAQPATGLVQMSKYKRTLPTGEEDHPTELYPLADQQGPVTFRAPVDGVTTSGSSYPRDELREYKAAWSNGDETHIQRGSCAVTALPGGKPEVVVAQIHDAKDDVVMLLVSGDKVYASWSKYPESGSVRDPLFSGYRLGDRLNYAITADPSGISAVVNGYKSSRQKIVSGAYFKAGCYTQANESNGTGAGEVVYYSLSLEN